MAPERDRTALSWFGLQKGWPRAGSRRPRSISRTWRPAAACPTRRRCSRPRGARPSSRRASWLAKLPLFIGGKSMGGRIASHIASQGCPGLSGVFFLGYPLHPPGAPEKRRDAHLPLIQEPMLFVQGQPRRVRHVRRNRCAAALTPARHASRGSGWRSFLQGPRPRRPQARPGAGLHHGHGSGVDGHAAEMMGIGIRDPGSGIRRNLDSSMRFRVFRIPDHGPRIPSG